MLVTGSLLIALQCMVSTFCSSGVHANGIFPPRLEMASGHDILLQRSIVRPSELSKKVAAQRSLHNSNSVLLVSRNLAGVKIQNPC
jgi:hypothetical protein